MKYTAKFVEMVDSRNKAIENMEKVVKDQTELLNYLTKDEEGREKFKVLIEGLKNNIKENEENIKKFTEANDNTLFLINKIKNADGKTTLFIEQIIKELGIFEAPEQPQAPEAPQAQEAVQAPNEPEPENENK